MPSFLAGHVEAFTFFGGVARRVLPDYVPRNIIVLMCPLTLCAKAHDTGGLMVFLMARWAHFSQRDSSQFSSDSSLCQIGFRGVPDETSEGGLQTRSAASLVWMLISA